MKLTTIIIICSCFIAWDIAAQIQKGYDIVLEKSMASGKYFTMNRLTLDGNELVLGDGGTCKSYFWTDNEWKIQSNKVISLIILSEYLEISADGNTVAVMTKDTLKIFDINENKIWIERPVIPEFIFSDRLPEIELSLDGKSIAILTQNIFISTSFVKIFSYTETGWNLECSKEYFTENNDINIQYDSLGKTLLMTNEDRNYVIFIQKQNDVWNDRKLFFTNGNNQKRSYKSYSLDAKICMDISYCSSANKVELIEYQIDVATGIKEVRSQTLDVCSYGYDVMSGDGNTLVFSDADALAFTIDTVWIYKRNADGYFAQYGHLIIGPNNLYSFGLGMSLDFSGNTLSVLVKPKDPSIGLKTYIQVYDLTKVSGTNTDLAESKRAIIYPNPTNGHLDIEDGWTINKVYNITGTLINNLSRPVYSYDMTDLPAGIYFIFVQKNNNTQVCKVLKI